MYYLLPVQTTPSMEDIASYRSPIIAPKPGYDSGSYYNPVPSFNCAECWIRLPLWI